MANNSGNHGNPNWKGQFKVCPECKHENKLGGCKCTLPACKCFKYNNKEK